MSAMAKRDFRMERQGEKLIFFKGTTAQRAVHWNK
jgi:hypothetical protein